METMLRVATAVEQVVTAVNTASEEEKVMSINRIVMSVMSLNGH
jgi:hypothetical protein